MHSPLTALKSIATIVPHQKPHNWPSSHNAYKVHATGAHDVSINNIDLETTNPWTTIILISVPLITIILLMVILTKSNMANIMNRLFGPGQQNTDCHQPVNGAIRSHSESKIASNRRRTSSSTTASSSSNNSRQGTMTTDSNQAIDKEQPPPQGSGMRKRSLNLSVKSLITTLVTSMSSSNSTSPLNSPSVPITHQSPRSAPLVISDKRPQGQSELSDGQSMGPDGKNCLNPDKSNHTHPTEAQSNITSPNKHINDVIAKEIIKMAQLMLEGLDNSDFQLYSRLCDSNMTTFEPESLGNLIESTRYVQLLHSSTNQNVPSPNDNIHSQNATNDKGYQNNSLILHPRVRVLSNDAACIAFVRLTQCLNRTSGMVQTKQYEETQIWQRKNINKWVCVHVHRSILSAPSM